MPAAAAAEKAKVPLVVFDIYHQTWPPFKHTRTPDLV